MEDVGEHRHCRVCRKVCGPDSETCSAKCAREYARRVESRRNYIYLLYALGATIVVVFVLSAVHL
jgi:predicted nucleic acid-binding Zn ribbon protein